MFGWFPVTLLGDFLAWAWHQISPAGNISQVCGWVERGTRRERPRTKRYSTFIRRGASSLPVNRVWKAGFSYFWSKHTHTNFAFFWRLKNSCVFSHFPLFLLIWENAALWLLPYTTCTVKVTLHGSEFPCPPKWRWGGGGPPFLLSSYTRVWLFWPAEEEGKILCGWHIRRRPGKREGDKLEVKESEGKTGGLPEEGLSTIFPRNVPKNVLEKLEKSSFKAFLPFIVAISLLLVLIRLLFFGLPPLFFRCPKPPLPIPLPPRVIGSHFYAEYVYFWEVEKVGTYHPFFSPSPYSYGGSPSFLGCIFLGFGSLNRGALKGGGKRHLLLRRSQKTCQGKT